jgi:hypothetical protein
MNINGLRVGDPVRSGRLNLHPIYGADVEMGFVGDVGVVADVGGYGGLTVQVGRPTIVPQGLVFFMEHAQDRAVRAPVYIGREQVDQPVGIQVVCIEPSQGGQWQEGKKQEKAMLPPSLIAGMLPSGRYSDLWDSIAARSRYDGGGERAVSKLLEGRVDSSLPVDKHSRGAMIALDGRPVAIELAPNRAAWQDWWVATNLGGVVTYDAMTLRDLPIPIGDQEMDAFPDVVGMQHITWGPFRGYAFTNEGGELCYISLHDEEALRCFVGERPTQGRQELREWEEV